MENKTAVSTLGAFCEEQRSLTTDANFKENLKGDLGTNMNEFHFSNIC